MKIEYIRNLNGSYMIIKDAEYSYENSELLMLLNNRIPGLLGLQIIISDGKMEYWYDITGTTSFGTLLDVSPLRGEKLRYLIENIYDMNRQLEDFMLDGENVQYLPELIYFDRATEKYLFCYLPGSKTIGSGSLQALTEHLLAKIDHKDADAVSMGYALYEKSIQECCSLQELLSCVVLPKEDGSEADSDIPIQKTNVNKDDVNKNNVNKNDVNANGVNKNDAENDSFKADRKLGRASEVDYGFSTEIKKEHQKKKKSGIFGGLLSKKRGPDNMKSALDYREQLKEMNLVEVVAEPMQSECPTMFLNMEKQVEIGRLIYQGENREENFLLEEELFLIGKDAEMVDGVIHADTVSRIHAKIFRLEGVYYIEDLNSTNGTYLNGREIFYRKPEKLEKQDRITFATEEYLFN